MPPTPDPDSANPFPEDSIEAQRPVGSPKSINVDKSDFVKSVTSSASSTPYDERDPKYFSSEDSTSPVRPLSGTGKYIDHGRSDRTHAFRDIFIRPKISFAWIAMATIAVGGTLGAGWIVNRTVSAKRDLIPTKEQFAAFDPAQQRQTILDIYNNIEEFDKETLDRIQGLENVTSGDNKALLHELRAMIYTVSNPRSIPVRQAADSSDGAATIPTDAALSDRQSVLVEPVISRSLLYAAFLISFAGSGEEQLAIPEGLDKGKLSQLKRWESLQAAFRTRAALGKVSQADTLCEIAEAAMELRDPDYLAVAEFYSDKARTLLRESASAATGATSTLNDKLRLDVLRRIVDLRASISSEHINAMLKSHELLKKTLESTTTSYDVIQKDLVNLKSEYTELKMGYDEVADKLNGAQVVVARLRARDRAAAKELFDSQGRQLQTRWNAFKASADMPDAPVEFKEAWKAGSIKLSAISERLSGDAPRNSDEDGILDDYADLVALILQVSRWESERFKPHDQAFDEESARKLVESVTEALLGKELSDGRLSDVGRLKGIVFPKDGKFLAKADLKELEDRVYELEKAKRSSNGESFTPEQSAVIREWVRGAAADLFAEWGYRPIPATDPDFERKSDTPLAAECFNRGYQAYFSNNGDGGREAISWFTEACRVAPNNALYRHFLGLAYYQGGRLEIAEDQVRCGAELERTVGLERGMLQKLERIQGSPRRWMERIRTDVRTTPTR